MTFLKGNASDPFVFDYEETKELGLDLASRYADGDPFPHIVIDDFLPQSVADYVIANFPETLSAEQDREFDRDQERRKKNINPDYMEPKLRSLFYAFNSRPFIKMVENITGISGLIGDPYFLGAGFHDIGTGGHLSVHADFNLHKPMHLERRVNMLIYLNPDWKPEYGGQLELWREDMSERVQSIVPLANRCAMFTTTETSMHGNPEVVAHPDDKSRRSIALYYYTATWDENRTFKTTQFRVRPNSDDKVDWQVRSNQFMTEYLPPVISRRLIRLGQKMNGPKMHDQKMNDRH
ncbi:MAG: 2OG-Fe(II) oxygenase [Pseudomonadota bacterium]